MSESLRETSKRNWTVSDDESVKYPEIQTGALLRIADATELMAKSWAEITASLEFWKRQAASARDEASRIALSNRSLRGVITRLKAETTTTTKRPSPPPVPSRQASQKKQNKGRDARGAR